MKQIIQFFLEDEGPALRVFFNKCDQFRRKLWIYLQLLKKSLTENFIFCAVNTIFAKKF